MSGVIYQAAAGALLQQIRLDMLSNNLANLNTVGFKSEKPVFRMTDLQEPSPHQTAAAGLSPLAPPLEQIIDFSSGPLQMTGNPLDTAIVGQGFFEVLTDSGLQYTRSGSFTVNTEGILSSADGWPVAGQGGTIAIQGSRVEIGASGEIIVDGTVVDTLRVVDFERPYELEKIGNARFVPSRSDLYAEPADHYSISQGYVEVSNVDAIRTMTELIETMRAFESYQRVIRNADEALGKTVNDVGRSV
jgi:flagellar basal-body rod protein FlgF